MVLCRPVQAAGRLACCEWVAASCAGGVAGAIAAGDADAHAAAREHSACLDSAVAPYQNAMAAASAAAGAAHEDGAGEAPVVHSCADALQHVPAALGLAYVQLAQRGWCLPNIPYSTRATANAALDVGVLGRDPSLARLPREHLCWLHQVPLHLGSLAHQQTCRPAREDWPTSIPMDCGLLAAESFSEHEAA